MPWSSVGLLRSVPALSLAHIWVDLRWCLEAKGEEDIGATAATDTPHLQLSFTPPVSPDSCPNHPSPPHPPQPCPSPSPTICLEWRDYQGEVGGFAFSKFRKNWAFPSAVGESPCSAVRGGGGPSSEGKEENARAEVAPSACPYLCFSPKWSNSRFRGHGKARFHTSWVAEAAGVQWHIMLSLHPRHHQSLQYLCLRKLSL